MYWAVGWVLHLVNGTKCLGHKTLWYYQQPAEWCFLGMGRKHYHQVPSRCSSSLGWDFAVRRGSCTAGSFAVSELNVINCNGFRQQQGEILCICWRRRRGGAMPTFTTVFQFTAFKPRYFCQHLWRLGDMSRNVCIFGSDIQMGHKFQGRLEDFWMKMEQFCCPSYGQMMVRAGYYHILHILHFADNNRNGVDKTDDRLIWKSKDELFRILQPCRTFGSRWSHCEIQGKGSFQRVHPEKMQTFLHQNV